MISIERRPGAWKRRMSVVSGKADISNKNQTSFSAPVDLFVYNVNTAINVETMKGYMKDNRGLNLIECEQVSHEDARTKIFKVTIEPKDYDLAMKESTWPYRVRVRQYPHFKKLPQEQFGVPKEQLGTRNRRNY